MKQLYSPISPVLKVIRVILGVLKFPAFVVTLMFAFLYYCIGLMMPVKRLRRIIIWGTSKVMFRILLLIMGYWNISQEVAPIIDTSLEAGDELEIQGGDIVIANFGSYINVFWLQCKYAPLFVIPVDENNVSVSSVFSLFMNMIALEPLNRDSVRPFSEVLQISKENGSPIVVFPEMTVSNGSLVLPFFDFTGGSDLKGHRLQIVGFLHRCQGISPNYVAGNGFFHLIKMIGRTMASLKVRIVAQSDTPDVSKNANWLEESRKSLAGILRIKTDKPHND